MIKGTDWAFPDPMRSVEQSYAECANGMQLRTWIATQLMTAILKEDYATSGYYNKMADEAVKATDSLIAALNKPVNNQP